MITEEKIKYIPLHYDLTFKNLFGTDKNKKFVIDMLEKLFNLEEGTLKEARITNSVHLTREVITGKGFELDVLVELPNGVKINLEMCRIYDSNAEVKNVVYVTGVFNEQLKTGEKYYKVKPVLQVDFVKGNILHNNESPINRYCMMNVNNPSDLLLSNLFNIIIIDVDAEDNLSYTEINKGFELWRRLIGVETLEEAESIVKGIPIMEEALEEMKRFNELDYVQEFSANEILRASQMDTFQDECISIGIERGIEQGSNNQKIAIAKNMITDNVDLNTISKYTGLSIQEIIKLKEEM